MNLEKLVVVAGTPGVHKIVASRSNGLIIDDRTEGRTRFVPLRQSQVTPLGTVGIYVDTDEGTVPLGEVWQKMLDQLEAHPLPDAKADSTALRAYFTAVLPEHDHFRVHINDIKKCVKWFDFAQKKELFEELKAEEAKAAAEAEAEKPAEPAEQAA